MKKVEKNFIEATASNVAQKRCGRCGTVIHGDGDDFCPGCREFFRGLNGRQVLSAGTRKRQTDWSVAHGQ